MLARRLLIGTAVVLHVGIVASLVYMWYDFRRTNGAGADEEGLLIVLLYAVGLIAIGLISWAVGYVHASRKGDDSGAACAWGALAAILVPVFTFVVTLAWNWSPETSYGHRPSGHISAALIWVAHLISRYPKPFFILCGIVLPYVISIFIAGRFRRRWASRQLRTVSTGSQ